MILALWPIPMETDEGDRDMSVELVPLTMTVRVTQETPVEQMAKDEEPGFTAYTVMVAPLMLICDE